jgi:predicted nucleic acid-binding protein
MPQNVYVETSIISYLTARPSRDVVTAAHQQLTLDWWRTARPGFRVFISELVVQEVSMGGPEPARLRLAALEGIPLLELSENARVLAKDLITRLSIPPRATMDALHVALAADNGVDFLLTWNCRHIANAKSRHLIERCLRSHGYDPPVLCTPEELMEP